MFRLLRWCLPTQAMSSASAKMGQQHKPLYFDMALLVLRVLRVKPVLKVRKETREPLVLRVLREIRVLLVHKDLKVNRVSKVLKVIRVLPVSKAPKASKVSRVNQDLRVFLLK